MSLPDRPETQALLEQAARAWQVPGAAFAISQGDQTEVFCTGVLNVETEEAVRPDSMFQIGSITKVWTASLMMLLVEQGRVKLDSPVQDYLHGFRTADPEAASAVTVRQLLCHTSGLDGDFFTDTGTGGDRMARYLDRCALLPQLFPVGEDFSYSNAAFNIAGRLIEVVTGLEFEAAIKRYLISPLGLKNTVIDVKELVGRSVSSGHSPDPDNPGQSLRIKTLYTLPLSGSPAGSSMMASPADLVAFARMHLAGGKGPEGEQILAAETVRAMQEFQVSVPVPARGIDAWGLGWFLMGYQQGARIFGHDGGTIGQSAFLRIDPQTDTVVVLYANGGKANDFMKEVFAQTFDPIASVSSFPEPPPARELSNPVDKYLGTYGNIGGEAVVYEQDGELYWDQHFQFDDTKVPLGKARLAYAGDDQFLSRLPGQDSPGLVSFLDPDEKGRPQRAFSGLRFHNRVG